ncbi:MAG: HDOD domain-containing protein [Thioalkalispiraceae bacterium]|jgi:HD-like signal output (HDOD) protein/prolyl-tRNA editing enzyme YbaK/EbsC (Cys-tRNA(Pro) deacylase)
MSFNDLILLLLETQQVPFRTLKAPDAVSLHEDWLEQTVPLHSVCRIAILQDNQGMVIALYPGDQQLVISRLQETLRRNVNIIDADAALAKLRASVHLPGFQLTKDHGIQIIIDERLTDQDDIHFEASEPCTLLKVDVIDLQRLAEDSLIGSSFSEPNRLAQPGIKHRPQLSIKDKIKKLERLPAMPDMPSRILDIRNDPNSTVDDLVAIVETDMSLSAQIIRYANSAIFTNSIQVVSLKDAIFRVLGYETVLHLSLGYALGRVFKLPASGPLGQENFWKHATYSAALAQQLAAAMPRNIRPKSGIAYLAGLLHDVGFLVLNLFFKHEYTWLNKMLAANPDSSILDTEARILGTTHNQLGQWLMQAWNMPEELTVTVAEHHNLDYTGTHAEYALLLNLTERLLKMHGMSDADTDEIPNELLEKLGLSEEEVFLITDEVLQGGETLKEMATSVSA